jgi:vitamin B12/bleomycin/antimicrobial peptide transport system ATP-binding/permease protein
MIETYRRAGARYLKTVRLFFHSPVGSQAIRWFTLLLGLLVAVNGLNVANSYVGRDFMTAVSDRRPRQFLTFAVLYCGVFIVVSIVAAFYRFSEERLRLLWRAWLTRSLMDRYLQNNAFYRLQANDEIDNPDERITEDVKSYTTTTLSFFLLSLNAVITSVAFLSVLWSITPRLVVAAVVYAGLGSAATILLGRPLIELANLQLKKEANFRYHLIQTRETAETLATMNAQTTMRDCLHERLDEVVANNRNIIAVTRNLVSFTNSYNYLTQVIPLLLVAPMYMRGEVEFGVVTQSAMAFAQVLGGFSLIITQFEAISSFAAVTDRLNRISEAIDQAEIPEPGSIEVMYDDTRVAYEKLTLWRRGEQRPLIKELSLVVPHGTNLLITGPNAAAKTALFLATTQVWEKGSGRIIRPAGDGICFVPKHPLAVRCGLRSQLVAPYPGQKFTDHELEAVLRKVGLEEMASRVGGLESEHDWAGALSPEENRLLALARVLLASPRFVFLDRMDGELTPDRIEQVYRLLTDSGISYLSVDEHENLRAHHNTILSLGNDGAWKLIPIREAADV